MVKRGIGIHIGSSHLCAVQISRIGEGFCIEKILNTQTNRSADSPSDVLKSLFSKYGFDRHATVATSLPNNAVFFRSLETDYVGLEQIRTSGSSSLEYDFPIESNEIVIQLCSYYKLSDDKYSVLTAAMARESLRDKLNVLLDAKIRPDLMEAAVFAIHSTVATNYPEIATGVSIIAYITDSNLIFEIIKNNNILIVRNMPVFSSSDENIDSNREQIIKILSREAEITWRKLFGAEIEQDTKIYLVTGDNNATDLKAAIEENLGCQTTIVNPYQKVKCLPEHNGDIPIDSVGIAEGLALRALAPGQTTGINFLEAKNADIKPKLNMKKEFVICAVLIGAIAFISLIGLFLRLSNLEAQYARVKNEIRKVFQNTLPEEENIVNPLAQLEQKLQSLRKEYALFDSVSSTGTLEVLNTVTTCTPPEMNIKLNNMLITTESVRLMGTSQSFESVYDWQRLLQDVPQFSNVDVRDIRRAPESERIQFIVLASFRIKEQE